MRFRVVVIMLWVSVFLMAATSLAFEDTNAIVFRVRRCLPEGGFVRSTKCEQLSERVFYVAATGLFFTVAVDIENGNRSNELVSVGAGTNCLRTNDIVVGFSTFRSPSAVLGAWMNYMTRIPVASCPGYDVIFMTSENPGYRFIDPVWQEVYKRLKKEFPDDPVYRRDD